MMKSLYKYVVLSALICCTACHKNEWEPYNSPFVHMMKSETTSTTVSESAVVVGEYYVYLSSPKRTSNLTVYYNVVVGNGLISGRDYQMISSGNSLTFLPGIYDIPVRVRWLKNKIDPSKDNTLKIVITGTDDESVSVGLPGPDHNQSSFLITKIVDDED